MRRIFFSLAVVAAMAGHGVDVWPYDRSAVAFVTSDAYRDTADAGWVKFVAAFHPPREQTEGKRLEAAFVWTDAFGARRRTPAKDVSSDSASLSLPIHEMAMGESDVVCELLADGRGLGAGTNRFARVAQLPKRKVSVDRFGRCLVDGKPFFPLGLSCGTISPRKVELLADSPFNCAMPHGVCNRKCLDMLAKGGIRGLVTVRPAETDTRWAREAKLPPLADAQNLLGWHVCCEPSPAAKPAPDRRYDFMLQADPEHPTWSVLDRRWNLRMIAKTCGDLDIDRYPGFEELRSIFWQPVARGATGLIGYKIESAFASAHVEKPNDDEMLNPNATNWVNVCRVAAEMKRMEDVILSVEPAPRGEPDCEAVDCRTWVRGESLYVLVTNPLREPLSFGVRLSEGDWRVAATEVGSAPSACADATLRYALGPHGVSFVRLEKRQDDFAATETATWQAAIDAAAARGGGRVVVPAGRHVVGQLCLKSNVELHLEKGSTLVGAFGWNGYPALELPCSEGVWRAVVFANGVTNVAVTGEGEIFGDGRRWPRAPAGYRGCQEGYRPRGMFFNECRNVRLEDFTLRDAACWGVVFKLCDGVVARRVKVDSHANSNNDGFDVEAKNVLIEDCDVDSGDDAVCVKSNSPDFAVENVTVRGCVARSQCNCYKIGTASHGTIRNVRFERCRIEPSRRDFPLSRGPRAGDDYYYWRKTSDCPAGAASGGLCVECVDGGLVENISFDDIEIAGGVCSPIFVRGGTRLRRKCGIPPNRHRILRNVAFTNVRGRSSGVRASSITGVDGCRVANVKLKDVRLEHPGADAAVSEGALRAPVPYLPESYPDANSAFGPHILPCYGLYVDRADGVALENAVFTLAEGAADVRPPVCRTDRAK